VSDTGFTLIDARKAEHQIAFDVVASVKQITTKSHTTRNILIGVGVGVAALGITAGILALNHLTAAATQPPRGVYRNLICSACGS
jgi:hypothetical protein